tara:strand:+ start:307 stop:513 length:207 start_codon:yes stop_codon:yes gene_type:complete
MKAAILEVGDLVHWYHYSHDMVIVDGGIGCVVGIDGNKYGNLAFVLFEVLCDDGAIQKFDPFCLEKVG